MTDSETHPLRSYRQAQTPVLTLEKLAAQVGTSKANLSRIETGDYEPSPELAKKISDATGVAMSDLCPALAKMFSGQAAE